MKEYKPEPWIPFPRWIEIIIQLFLWWIIIALAYLFELKGLHGSPGLQDFIIISTLVILYKLFRTFTAVDLITIDFDNKKIYFTYWLFYVFKKHISIGFNELDYKNKYEIPFHGTSMGLFIYENKRIKIIITSSNGWKSQQIDELIEELSKIKEPIKPLVARRY